MKRVKCRKSKEKTGRDLGDEEGCGKMRKAERERGERRGEAKV